MAAYVHLCSCGLRRPQHFCPPMADYTLQDAMELALSTEGIDGVVLDPWSHSATLDGALLNGLLHAGHTPEDPGDEKADAGKEAARKGNWAQAVECFEKAAELGSAMGLALLADCIYRGRGTRTNRAKPAACGRKQQTAARSYPTLHWAMTTLPGATMAGHFCITAVPAPTQPICRISSTLRRCACVWPRPNALHQPQKGAGTGRRSKAGLCHQAREHEPDAEQWLAEADQLIRELTSELPARATAYDMESLQLD